MIDNSIVFTILDKYDRYFSKNPITGSVYYVYPVDHRNLEKEILNGKIVGSDSSFYFVKTGEETIKVRKHLCFKDYHSAERFREKILIDELRIIS